MRDSFRVPVRDVLKVDALHGSAVLAGQAGVQRLVTDLSVAESPDALGGMREHSFVMTGGFSLQHLGAPGTGLEAGKAVDELAGLVRDLNERGVAGLGVQFGPHLVSLPAHVLAVADELSFPIVALPTDRPFATVFSQTITDVVDGNTATLKWTYELHGVLAGRLLEGADIQAITEQIAESMGVGVLVTSVDGREMADALSVAMRERLAANDLFDETGRFRIERVRSSATGIDSGEAFTEPIQAAGNDLARIVAYAPDKEIGDDVQTALRTAASVLALLITQRQALNIVENKYRGDFLHDVLSGRAKDSKHSQSYAAGLGWQLSMPCIVLAAQIDPQGRHEEQASTRLRSSWQTRFHLAWTQVLGRESRSYPCADFSDEVVAILFAQPGESSENQAEVVAGLQSMVERMVLGVSGDRGGGRRPFSVGTSRLVTSFCQLPAAYQQARRATEVGRRFSGGSSTAHFDDLGIHRLIGLIPDHEELTAFASDVLKELAEETPPGHELRTTLQVLLDNNLNVAEASRELVMHYNTMRYRITKLEKIIGPFTTDAQLRLNVAVALQIQKIRR